MDARINNGRPSNRQRTSNTAEQPGMIAGIHNNFGHCPGVQRFGDDSQGCRPAFRIADHAGVAHVGFGVKRQPITRVTQSHEEITIGFRPAERLQNFIDTLFGSAHAAVAFGGGQPASQHFGNPAVNFAQQSCFPAIPHFAANRPHISNG